MSRSRITDKDAPKAAPKRPRAADFFDLPQKKRRAPKDRTHKRYWQRRRRWAARAIQNLWRGWRARRLPPEISRNQFWVRQSYRKPKEYLARHHWPGKQYHR